MPITLGQDLKGYFYQYGTHGKKYYFFTERGKQIAYTKAKKQGIAIRMSQHGLSYNK